MGAAGVVRAWSWDGQRVAHRCRVPTFANASLDELPILGAGLDGLRDSFWAPIEE